MDCCAMVLQSRGLEDPRRCIRVITGADVEGGNGGKRGAWKEKALEKEKMNLSVSGAT